MKIKTVELTETGNYTVNKDTDMISAPNDMGNRHRVMIQEWIDAGNTPDPFVPPVKTWEENRQAEYAKLNQFEMQFDDQRDSTTTWVDAVNAIKSKFPKPTG
jgi:hypothetical protein